MAGENPVTIHDNECREYSEIDTPIEIISLPGNQVPAVEGDTVIDRIMSRLRLDSHPNAVGVATDQPVPLWREAVEILPPHIMDVSALISSTAGFDRLICL